MWSAWGQSNVHFRYQEHIVRKRKGNIEHANALSWMCADSHVLGMPTVPVYLIRDAIVLGYIWKRLSNNWHSKYVTFRIHSVQSSGTFDTVYEQCLFLGSRCISGGRGGGGWRETTGQGGNTFFTVNTCSIVSSQSQYQYWRFYMLSWMLGWGTKIFDYLT